MAIARKPGSKPPPADDARADSFISGAGQAPVAPPAASVDTAGGRRQPVMIRFDKELLARVDKAAKRRGVNRSAWISYVISQALEAE
jgi:hypothetical protein